MRVLIIGGTGILSSAVVDECLNQGIEVTMINRGNRPIFINEKAELIKSDIFDVDGLKTRLQGRHFDSVIDFLVLSKPDVVRSINTFGKVSDQYVFISSAQVYNTSYSGVLTETAESPHPQWAYSVNKGICERYVAEKCKELGLNYTIIRPGVNYGNTRIPYGVFPRIGQHWTFVARILAGKPILTWNNGENQLNLTRVEDFATGVVGLLGNSMAYNEPFNVVGDYVYSWKEVLDTLGNLIGKEVKTLDIPLAFYCMELNGMKREELLAGRANDLVCSNEKLKSVVPDFRTRYQLEEGLAMTLDFYKSNNYYQGFDYEWDAECDRVINDYLRHLKREETSYSYICYNAEDTSLKKTQRIYYDKYFQYSKSRKFLYQLNAIIKG